MKIKGLAIRMVFISIVSSFVLFAAKAIDFQQTHPDRRILVVYGNDSDGINLPEDTKYEKVVKYIKNRMRINNKAPEG